MDNKYKHTFLNKSDNEKINYLLKSNSLLNNIFNVSNKYYKNNKNSFSFYNYSFSEIDYSIKTLLTYDFNKSKFLNYQLEFFVKYKEKINSFKLEVKNTNKVLENLNNEVNIKESLKKESFKVLWNEAFIMNITENINNLFLFCGFLNDRLVNSSKYMNSNPNIKSKYISISKINSSSYNTTHYEDLENNSSYNFSEEEELILEKILNLINYLISFPKGIVLLLLYYYYLILSDTYTKFLNSFNFDIGCNLGAHENIILFYNIIINKHKSLLILNKSVLENTDDKFNNNNNSSTKFINIFSKLEKIYDYIYNKTNNNYNIKRLIYNKYGRHIIEYYINNFFIIENMIDISNVIQDNNIIKFINNSFNEIHEHLKIYTDNDKYNISNSRINDNKTILINKNKSKFNNKNNNNYKFTKYYKYYFKKHQVIFNYIEDNFTDLSANNYSTFICQKYLIISKSNKIFNIINNNILCFLNNRNSVFVLFSVLDAFSESNQSKKLNKFFDSILKNSEIICKNANASTLMENIFQNYPQIHNRFIDVNQKHIGSKFI